MIPGRRSTPFEDELRGYELELRVDMVRPPEEEVPGVKVRRSPDPDEGDYVDGYWINEFEDRSVGIFGGAISPIFYKLADLEEWWKQHKPALDALPWDGPQKDYEDAYGALVDEWQKEQIPGKTVAPYKPKSEALREAVDNIRDWVAERELSVPEKHQLRIARDTLKMSDAGAKIMGGPSKEQAREIIKRLTGKEPKDEAAFGARRPENQRMVDFLAQNGLPNVRVKYIADGSMKGTWRLYNPNMKWSEDLAAKLNELGFKGFDGAPLGKYSGNGGLFSTFVRGHNELLGEPQQEGSDTQIANTILQQMGGAVQLRVMLGVKHFIGHPDGVSFTWPNPQRSRGNGVRITLMPDDTYKMEFVNATVGSIKPVQTYEGLYADQLVSTFERQTGWYLSLGRKEAQESLTRDTLDQALHSGQPIDATREQVAAFPEYEFDIVPTGKFDTLASGSTLKWRVVGKHSPAQEDDASMELDAMKLRQPGLWAVRPKGRLGTMGWMGDGTPWDVFYVHARDEADAIRKANGKVFNVRRVPRKEDEGEPAPAPTPEPTTPTKGPLVVMPTGEHGWRLARIKAGLDPKEVLTRHPDWKLPKGNPPTARTMEKWDADGVARATDGCKIEPDGVCIHGHPSWLLAMGVI